MTNNHSFHYSYPSRHLVPHTHAHTQAHVLLYSIESFLLVKGRAPEIRARSFISLLFFPPSLYTLRPHFFELPLFATSFLLSPLLHRVPPDYRGSTWLLMTTWDHRREMQAYTHTLSDPSTSPLHEKRLGGRYEGGHQFIEADRSSRRRWGQDATLYISIHTVDS